MPEPAVAAAAGTGGRAVAQPPSPRDVGGCAVSRSRRWRVVPALSLTPCQSGVGGDARPPGGARRTRGSVPGRRSRRRECPTAPADAGGSSPAAGTTAAGSGGGAAAPTFRLPARGPRPDRPAVAVAGTAAAVATGEALRQEVFIADSPGLPCGSEPRRAAARYWVRAAKTPTFDRGPDRSGRARLGTGAGTRARPRPRGRTRAYLCVQACASVTAGAMPGQTHAPPLSPLRTNPPARRRAGAREGP